MNNFFNYKTIILILLDMLIINISYLFSFIIKFDFTIPVIYRERYI